eukprot:4392062-Pleurochrysis_carterae.AAC.1
MPHVRFLPHRCGELKVQKDRYAFRTDEESREQRARVRVEEVKDGLYNTPLRPGDERVRFENAFSWHTS